jgi:hypothetical protein
MSCELLYCPNKLHASEIDIFTCRLSMNLLFHISMDFIIWSLLNILNGYPLGMGVGVCMKSYHEYAHAR